jgi:hypothetical protein
LNLGFEKAGVAYGPRPEHGSEASAEVAKKIKANACVWPAGKRTKVVGKKKVAATPSGTATPMAAMAPKGTSATVLRIADVPPKATPSRVAALPKPGAP